MVKIKWLVYGLLAYLILHSAVEQLLAKLLVVPVLSGIDAVWYNDIAFLVIAVLALVPLYKRRYQRFPSRGIPILFSFFSLVYLGYRVTDHAFSWTGFSFFDRLKYADIFLLVVIVYAIQAARSNTRTWQPADPISFDNDHSLGETGTDLLGYTPYAKNLANKIRCSRFDNAFAIGINAKWGFGKTSFIDLLKRELNATDYITIDFNPWNSQTPQAMTKDFFDTVEEALRMNYPNISGQIVNYANKLVALHSNSVSKTLQSATSMVFGYDSLNSLYKTINRSLQKIEKKILIFIDDLDRLDKVEVLEVIRLVRNTANFHNTFFIVCYDKQYINAALKEHNSSNPQSFLEKIFQIEINLPYFPKQVLRKVLADKLFNAFENAYHPEIRVALFGSSIVTMVEITDWLHSMRDVTRLFNNINLNLPPLLGEVEVTDFIRLEVLRLRFPAVYELLHREREEIFDKETNYGNENRYFLRRGRNLPKFMKIDEADHQETVLAIYLRRDPLKMQIEENQIPEIVDFVQVIFKDNSGYRRATEGFRSVAYPEKFDRYFAYSLFADRLSNVEFIQAVNFEEEALLKKIDDWVDRGLVLELQNRFIHFNEFSSKEQFEKIIRAIFYLANKPNEGPYYPFVQGYDGRNLLDKLGSTRNEQLYDAHGGREAMRGFIKAELAAAPSPYHFASEFLAYVNSSMVMSSIFPLSQKELEEISLTYLRSYARESPKIDVIAMRLFWQCQQTDFSPPKDGAITSRKYFPVEVRPLIRELIQKDVNAFLYLIIDLETIHQQTAAISGSVLDIFEDWDNFRDFLGSEDDTKWSYINEFREFYKVFEASGHVKYVRFDFKVIPVANKRRKV